MPCYQINTVSLEFKAKNVELIMEVLDEMGLRPDLIRSGRMINSSIGIFDLTTGKVDVPSYKVDKVNKFRVKYSEKVLKVAAKKNKWVVKRRAKNQYVAKKW